MTTEYAEIRRQYAEDKTFILVMATFKTNGSLGPISFEWEGQRINIDRFLSSVSMAELNGGSGCRYTCRAQGKDFYLFYDGVRWYIKANSLGICR